MKVLKIIILCILIVGCKVKNDNLYFWERYGLSNSSYSMIKIDYDDLNKMVENNFDGCIFVLREDCSYCHDLMQIINKKLNKINYGENVQIYIIESDKLSEEIKLQFAEEYTLTSVPSILFFENGKLKLTEISIPSEQRLNELIEMIIEY